MAVASEQSQQPQSEPDGDTPTLDPVPDGLRRELQDLGLTPYEARVLLAMLQLGPATTMQVAHLSGVPRTSTYPVLRGLSAKQLAHRVPGKGPAIWACVSRDKILERLDAAEQERLRQHRARGERVRTMLAEALPEDSPPAQPPVRLLYTAAEKRATYQRLASGAQAEALLFIRPPFAPKGDDLDPVVADLAARVQTRVLYEAEPDGGSDPSPALAAMQACRDAGGHACVVDELPMGLAVFDRKVALVTLDGPNPAHVDFPMVAMIEHAGFAAVLTQGFQYHWTEGAPPGWQDT